MKFITSFILIFLFNFSLTNANENIIPLNKSINEFNLKSPKGKLNYLAYFSLRCGSLFSDINEVKPHKNYLNASLNLQESAVITAIMIKINNQKKIKQEVVENIKSYKNIYSKIIQDNYTTNYKFIIGSKLLESDEESCKSFVPRAYRFLKNNQFNIRK